MCPCVWRLPLTVALAVSAVATSGCGGSTSRQSSSTTAQQRYLSPGQVERGIVRSLSGSSAAVSGASCPTEVRVSRGSTFACLATLGTGAMEKVNVKQLGNGRYTYAVAAGPLNVPGSTAEAVIEKHLAMHGVPYTTVRCPPTIIVHVGATVTCGVSDAPGARSVRFTFSTAEGTVEPGSVKAY